MIIYPNFKRIQNNKNGFTLIEMTLVVLIISILMAIAIPAFLKARSGAQTRACISNLRHIQDAKERWAMDLRKTNDAVPTTSDLAPNYIKKFPACPAAGRYTIGPVGQTAGCDFGPDHKLN